MNIFMRMIKTFVITLGVIFFIFLLFLFWPSSDKNDEEKNNEYDQISKNINESKDKRLFDKFIGVKLGQKWSNDNNICENGEKPEIPYAGINEVRGIGFKCSGSEKYWEYIYDDQSKELIVTVQVDIYDHKDFKSTEEAMTFFEKHLGKANQIESTENLNYDGRGIFKPANKATALSYGGCKGYAFDNPALDANSDSERKKWANIADEAAALTNFIASTSGSLLYRNIYKDDYLSPPNECSFVTIIETKYVGDAIDDVEETKLGVAIIKFDPKLNIIFRNKWR